MGVGNHEAPGLSPDAAAGVGAPGRQGKGPTTCDGVWKLWRGRDKRLARTERVRLLRCLLTMGL